jgi:hypothetical protein
MQTGIPHHVISRLLSIHWTWVNPTFNWVYRPAFMRELSDANILAMVEGFEKTLTFLQVTWL